MTSLLGLLGVPVENVCDTPGPIFLHRGRTLQCGTINLISVAVRTVPTKRFRIDLVIVDYFEVALVGRSFSIACPRHPDSTSDSSGNTPYHSHEYRVSCGAGSTPDSKAVIGDNALGSDGNGGRM